jgi:hypothetical protein
MVAARENKTSTDPKMHLLLGNMRKTSVILISGSKESDQKSTSFICVFKVWNLHLQTGRGLR